MNNNRFIIAVLLTGLILWGWQTYLKSKYGLTGAVTAGDATSKTPTPPLATGAPVISANDAIEPLLPSQSKQYAYTNPKFQLQVSENGMSLREIELIGFKDRNQNPVKLGGDVLFALSSENQKRLEVLPFRITKKSDNEFVGVSESQQLQVQQTLVFDPDTYSVDGTVDIVKKDPNAKSIGFYFREPFYTPPEKMPFASFEKQQVAFRSEGKLTREKIEDQKKANDVQSSASNLLSLSSQYFATAFLDRSGQLPSINASHAANSLEVTARAHYSLENLSEPIQLKWRGYFGPKSVALLEKADPELSELVDFGFFGAIAKILLTIMKWVYKFVGNWGIAIIFVTLVVRALVLPFNVMAYKSMKNMQLIQPKLQSLRERYKEDPMALNRETMAVMREHKVNPLGGCLPTLLQMPVFFALYQVLGQSLELYQAPFFGWIHDLSLKDPLYILPVLTGLAMFIQQKTTPTTMDPQQAKILQWMPVLFTFFTISLPSGLTLYIMVSTLFSLFQQKFFLRGGKA